MIEVCHCAWQWEPEPGDPKGGRWVRLTGWGCHEHDDPGGDPIRPPTRRRGDPDLHTNTEADAGEYDRLRHSHRRWDNDTPTRAEAEADERDD